jgi:geranylgeranyl pyrophosphate synthase
MLALAREAASTSQCSVLDRVGPSATDADVAAIQQVMIDTGAVGKVAKEIERLLDEALGAIDALPDVNGSREALRALADFVVDRDT